MITIIRSQFENLKNNHPDYFSKAIKPHTHDGKTCHAGKDYCGFASVITGDPKQGTTLLFEHIHFEIEGREPEMKELKDYRIDDINAMLDADAWYYSNGDFARVKGHEIFFVDFGKPFGYSALVFCENHHIYHADLFELHYSHMDYTRKELRKRYIEILNNKLYTEEELTSVSDYDDYQAKTHFLRNYYGMRKNYVSMFGIFHCKEDERKHEEAIKGKTFNPVTFGYYDDKDFVKKCVNLLSGLEKAVERLNDSPEYWKEAFKKEMYNHEYMINWQANYDTLSAFGRIEWNDDDSETEYFKQLDFTQVQKNAWYAAKHEYYAEAKDMF